MILHLSFESFLSELLSDIRDECVVGNILRASPYYEHDDKNGRLVWAVQLIYRQQMADDPEGVWEGICFREAGCTTPDTSVEVPPETAARTAEFAALVQQQLGKPGLLDIRGGYFVEGLD